jgi:hypothetical protein
LSACRTVMHPCVCGQRRAGSHALDDNVAFIIAGTAADQIVLQADDPAARNDVAKNVSVSRDAATLDDPLLLDLAVLLVHFAGQQEVAGGAHTDALVTDDLVGTENWLLRRSM